MDKDIFLNKKASIERCLARVREEMSAEPDPLSNPTRQDAVVLNIQRACETAIDIAMHAISAHKLGLPQSARDAFKLLETAGALSQDVATRMQRMVGFRNIAIHEYQALNPVVLRAVVAGRLGDFADFLDSLHKKWPTSP